MVTNLRCRSALIPPPANFEIERVPAGIYRLEARSSGYSELTVNVAGNLDGLQMHMAPKMPIPVSVRTESTGGSTPANRQTSGDGQRAVPIYFLLRKSVSDREAAIAGPEQDSDGNHLVVSVPPGRYHADITSLTATYVQAAHYGNVDLLQDDLIVSPGTAPRPIEIVLRDDGATLNVKVPSADSMTPSYVVVLPESAPTQVRVINVFGTTEAGIAELAPGNYKLFAFDSIEQIEFRNPEVLDQYSSKAAKITLNVRSQASTTLELIHTEE